MLKVITAKEISKIIRENKLKDAVFAGHCEYDDHFGLMQVVEGSYEEPIKMIFYDYYYEEKELKITLVDYTNVKWDEVDTEDPVCTSLTKEEALKLRGLL